MKVAKWKVLSIAGALVLGYAASAKAVKVFEGGEDQFLELKGKVKAYYLSTVKEWEENGKKKDEQTSGIVSSLDVSVEGQVNEYIQFAADIPDGDATITFAYIPQLQVTIGKTGFPFENVDSAIPVNSGINDPLELLIYGIKIDDIMSADNYLSDSYGLIMLHGDPLGNGMLNYQVAIFKYKDGEDFSFAGRVDVSPAAMGVLPSGINVNIGLGYSSLKKAIEDNEGNKKDVTGITGDITFEINMTEQAGIPIVPKIQVGYISLDKTHLDGEDLKGSSILYVPVEVLYDQVVGIGKPAIAFEYDSLVDEFSKDNRQLTRMGIALNYYIKDGKAQISIGGNNFTYKQGDDELKYKETYIFTQVKF